MRSRRPFFLRTRRSPAMPLPMPPVPGLPPAGRLLLAAAGALLLTAAGCNSPRPVAGTSAPPASSRASNVTVGEVFEVERGATVFVDGHRLRFESVVTDSRCPADVDCVRAGEAVVAFSFVGARAIGEVRFQIPGYATVETAPQPEQSVTRGAFRFTLLALDPYPGTEDAGPNARPVATLRAERL